MELSQAQHAGFSLYLCVQHAQVKDASLPHHVLVHYALEHLVKDAPTCSGALVHASSLQSGGHLLLQSILICIAPLQSALVKLCFHIQGDVKLERGAPCTADPMVRAKI